MSTDDLFSDLGSVKDELSDEKVIKADIEVTENSIEEDTPVDELFDDMPSIEEDFATDDRIINTTDPEPLIKKVIKHNTRKVEIKSDADLFDDLSTIKEHLESDERVVMKKTTIVRKKRQDKFLDPVINTKSEEKKDDLFDDMKSLEEDLSTEDRIINSEDRNKNSSEEIEDDDLFSDLD